MVNNHFEMTLHTFPSGANLSLNNFYTSIGRASGLAVLPFFSFSILTTEQNSFVRENRRICAFSFLAFGRRLLVNLSSLGRSDVFGTRGLGRCLLVNLTPLGAFGCVSVLEVCAAVHAVCLSR